MSATGKNRQDALSAPEGIQDRIFIIRGEKVMLDRDLAVLYGVETKYLNRQVRRNKLRFPEEFVFQLTKTEKQELVTNCHRFESLKHSVALPYAFTEHGVAMLASVLNSRKAIKASIYVIKVFIALRKWVSTQKEISTKLDVLERKVEKHDSEIQSILEAIRRLVAEPEPPPRRRIGFRP